MKLKKDGELVDDPKEMAKMLNHFFKNKPEKLAAEVVRDAGIDPLEKLREK